MKMFLNGDDGPDGLTEVEYFVVTNTGASEVELEITRPAGVRSVTQSIKLRPGEQASVAEDQDYRYSLASALTSVNLEGTDPTYDLRKDREQ